METQITFEQSVKAALAVSETIKEECGADIPWHQGLVFFLIAQGSDGEGRSMQELAQRADLAQSSISRNVAALGKWHRLQKPGLNLVETFEDPRDRRRKPVYLTAKGRNVIHKITKKLERYLHEAN